MQLRPVNFPVEDGQLLTQDEILCRESCTGDDQAPDEQKESGDEDHKKDESYERAEWLMISLTASSSMRNGVFGRDRLIILAGNFHFMREPTPVMQFVKLTTR